MEVEQIVLAREVNWLPDDVSSIGDLHAELLLARENLPSECLVVVSKNLASQPRPGVRVVNLLPEVTLQHSSPLGSDSIADPGVFVFRRSLRDVGLELYLGLPEKKPLQL